jgi:hypothetical protein
MTVWRISEDHGILKVQRGSRALPGDYRDEAAALKYINEHKARGDKVVRVADDGYETPVRRRRWRK